MKANHPQVVENQNMLNDLMRRRAVAKRGTHEYRQLTTRVRNMQSFMEIITQRQHKEV